MLTFFLLLLELSFFLVKVTLISTRRKLKKLKKALNEIIENNQTLEKLEL